MRTKKFYEGNNFYLVEERHVPNSKLPSIIKSSGYTIDSKGINELWGLTQLRTLFHSDRRHLPDPVIFENSKWLDSVYQRRSVYTLYLKPLCTSIKYAQKEISDYVNKSAGCFDFIGHSKGGLIFSGLDIARPSKFIFIAPTFGCIMGNEADVYRKVDEYKKQYSKGLLMNFELEAYKKFVHLIGSRRPVDYDMALGSAFLNDLSFDGLKKHRVLLITATCPTGKCSLQDTFFRHTGSFLGLDKDGDGMMSLQRQMAIKDYAELIVQVTATHPTVLDNPSAQIAAYKFLLDR